MAAEKQMHTHKRFYTICNPIVRLGVGPSFLVEENFGLYFSCTKTEGGKLRLS